MNRQTRCCHFRFWILDFGFSPQTAALFRIPHSAFCIPKSAWLAFTLLLTVCLSATPDTLYLRAGEQESGRLEKLTPDAVVFKGVNGEKTFPKADVTSIQLQQARLFDDVEKADQITDPDLKACIEKAPTEKDYPADGLVTLLQRKIYDLSTPGIVKETNRVITKILRQRGEDVGSVNVWYFDDTDTPNIDFALTVTPDGRVLHLSDAALKDESIFSRLPEYRRLSRLRFACKEPRPGSILDVQYTIVRKRDPVLEPFYTDELFRDTSPLLRKEVKAILGNGNGGQSPISFDIRPSGTQIINLTTVDNPKALLLSLSQPQPGVIQEPLMPPFTEFAPTATLAATTTWKDISKAYAVELAKIAPPSDALKAKAVELAKQGGSRAIYNFVVRGIRTAPVPQTSYRMIPHSPDDTAKRGLANELDKNFLYCKILEAAGIECAFALVRDRGQGPISDTAPSIRAFNRSAVYLTKEKRFSNVNSDLLPYESLAGDLEGPSGDLQDVPTLLIIPEGAELTRTQPPSLKDELQTKHFDATLSEDGALELSVVYAGTGNGGIGLRSLKDLDDQEMRNQMQQIVGAIHPAAVLKDYKTTELADLDVAPELTFNCSIPGYAFKAGEDLMLFNLPTVDYDAGDVGRPTREHDLYWPRVSQSLCEGAITLPKGFKVYSMPKSVRFNAQTVSYRAKLTQKRGAIHFSDQSDTKLQQAPKEAYPDYKHFKELRADLARQRIILTRE